MGPEKEYLDRLVEKRNRAWNAAQDVLKKAVAEERQMDGEERQTYDQAVAEVDQLDVDIKDMHSSVERNREAEVAREAYASVVQPVHEERQAVSEIDQIAALARGEIRTANFDFRAVAAEKAAIRAGAGERELRDLIKDTAAAGGNTVPSSFMRQLYDYLELYSAVRQTNVTILTTATGESLTIPTVAVHGTAALKGEGTALAEADPTFGTVALGAWKYGQLLQISNEMLADTGVNIQGFIAEDMGRAIARVTDAAYTSGTGSSQPQGFLGQFATSVTTQTVATGVPSYANLVDLFHSVEPLYRAQGAYWMTSDSNIGKLRQIIDTTGRPLWQTAVAAGAPDTLLGAPVIVSPNITNFATAAAGHLVFGNFSGLVIRDVGTINLARSDDFAFSTDLVTFRTTLRTDSKIRDTRTIRIAKSPTT